MIDSPSFRMAERLAKGNLAGILRERREESKHSFSRIARDLWAEFGIDVTPQTVANWCEVLLAPVSTDAESA